MSKTKRNLSLPHLKNACKTMYPIEKQFRNPLREKSKDKGDDGWFEIGEYRANRDDLLGKGFCSKVYRGKHQRTGLQVALKVIQLQKIKSPIQKRLLNNQMTHLASLRGSKNILQLVEIVREKTQLAIVTELCSESLSQRLRKNQQTPQKKLGEKEAIKILEDVLRGYLSMRAHGLLHRDIKPANILFGTNDTAMLGDLGFATRDEDLQKDKYVNVGSPLYMAPQVLKGNCYSAKADIWAIGVVFLEMIIGELPWAREREQNLRDIILTIEFDKLIPNELSSNSRDLLKCMLQTDARRRIGTSQIMKYFSKGVFQISSISEVSQDPGRSGDQQSLSRFKVDNKTKITIETTVTELNNNTEEHNSSSTYNLFKKTSKDQIKEPHMPLKVKLLRSSTPSENIINRSYKPLLAKKGSIASLQPKEEEDPLRLKLRLDDEFEQIRKEQLSQLYLCRFVFKIIELLVQGKDNIHFTYLDCNVDLDEVLGEFIIQVFDQIREIKSQYPKDDIKRFRKGKDFRNLLKLVEKYEANYREYFNIKMKKNIEAGNGNIEQVLANISQYLSSGGQHLKLIDQEMEKSDLQEVWDQQICQFSILIDYLASLKQLLKLKQRGTVLFARMSKIQEISGATNAKKLKISDIHKICRKIA